MLKCSEVSRLAIANENLTPDNFMAIEYVLSETSLPVTKLEISHCHFQEDDDCTFLVNSNRKLCSLQNINFSKAILALMF